MLAGLQFYQMAVIFQGRYRISQQQKISNHLQTNATLIDNEWAQFFKDHCFRISTSIDGPDWLHNMCRTDKFRNGTFRKTIKGIEILNHFGMNVGVVSTINRHNVKFPDLVYQTLIRLGIKSFELNIASKIDGDSSFVPSVNDTIEFLIRVFDIWFKNDDPSIYIRIFHNSIRSLMGLPTRDCSFSYNRCREYVACDEQGDLYTCGRFLKEPEAYIGSCVSDFVIQLMNSEKTKDLYKQVAQIKDECQKCRWLGACGGGCAYQRWLNGGFGSLFPQCRIRKALFEHIEKCIAFYLNTGWL